MTLLSYTIASPAPLSCPHNPLAHSRHPGLHVCAPLRQCTRTVVCVCGCVSHRKCCSLLPGNTTRFYLLSLRLPPRPAAEGYVFFVLSSLGPGRSSWMKLLSISSLNMSTSAAPCTLYTILERIRVHAHVPELQCQSELYLEQAEQAQQTA
jgi:hypothetical protein